MNQPLQEFDNGDADIEMDEHIQLLEDMKTVLRPDQILRLYTLAASLAPREDVEYGADFDLKDEVQAQIMAVRAMRDAVMPGGRVRQGVPAREVKEVVTASSTLLNTLLKMHEKVLSFDRQRAIEEAVTDTIRTLPDEQQKLFMTALEDNLSRIE